MPSWKDRLAREELRRGRRGCRLAGGDGPTACGQRSAAGTRSRCTPTPTYEEFVEGLRYDDTAGSSVREDGFLREVINDAIETQR